MISLRHRFLSSVALTVLLCAAPAYSQPSTGRLSGVVHDATGAAVPGATVTITNVATNATQTVTSSADGSYSVNVPPGAYTVTVSLRGFGRQTRKELEVDGGGGATADFALEPQLQEEVTVTAMRREQNVEDVPFSV